MRGYVDSRIILFSSETLPAIQVDMPARFGPALAVLLLGMMAQALYAQPESGLPLDPPKQGKLPFRQGDQLEIQCDTTAAFAGSTHITVLDATNWPWILVKSPQGEVWLNFNHVVTARNTAAPN